MAEGVQEEDSGDVIMATTGAEIKREMTNCLSSSTEEGPQPVHSPSSPERQMCIDSSSPPALVNGHADNSAPETPSSGRSRSVTPEQPDIKSEHLNGLAGLLALQNLQNFTPIPGMSAALPGIAGLAPQLLNSPLNLSVAATGSLTNGNCVPPPNLLPPSAQSVSSLPQLLTAQQPAAMPQFILASGQLVQGIQGAQLLIPTSQGIATQMILTIPVNHFTGNQIVNLALSNGQVVTTTLANLQALAQPHHLLTPGAPNGVPSPGSSMNLHPAAGNLSNMMSNSSPVHHQQQHQQLLSAMQQQPVMAATQPSTMPTYQQPPRHHHSQHSSYPMHETKHTTNGMLNGVSNPMNVISRLAATNSDITITASNNGQLHNSQPQSLHHQSHLMKPVQHPSSNGSHHGRGSPDFLDDSPNQPTINQASSNVVDGINLDEIKEFAKAFKLRRLSLGLTQTQVGQALSITEGPAYSQSAICSALATQMLCAAQIASQQQTMFEKLDITPKSAQKIKPVLEMWMKEAEERYKSGQNHLTEFIGMEPSKKRKRRTSFTPQALELLNAHFERNTHPSGTEITALAHQLGYEREVIRIWFCNKRQALKNTVRMMSKGMV